MQLRAGEDGLRTRRMEREGDGSERGAGGVA